MKRFTLLVAMIATAFAVKAQDLIVLRNATEIQAKVEAITQETISYKRTSNPDGPTYTIYRSEVFYIKYQNGEKDVFADMTATPATTTPAAKSSVPAAKSSVPAAKSYSASAKSNNETRAITPIGVAGYVMAGMLVGEIGAGSIGSLYAGPTLDFSVGAKIYERFYMGVETGLAYFISVNNPKVFSMFVPVGVNMKGYLTRESKVTPYLNCSLGAYIGVDDAKGVNVFNFQVGAGFEAGIVSVGAGYSGFRKDGIEWNGGYIKLGIAF